MVGKVFVLVGELLVVLEDFDEDLAVDVGFGLDGCLGQGEGVSRVWGF